jgi:hypothetical protein
MPHRLLLEGVIALDKSEPEDITPPYNPFDLVEDRVGVHLCLLCGFSRHTQVIEHGGILRVGVL